MKNKEVVELEINVVTVVYLESKPVERRSIGFEQAMKVKCLVISERVIKCE